MAEIQGQPSPIDRDAMSAELGAVESQGEFVEGGTIKTKGPKKTDQIFTPDVLKKIKENAFDMKLSAGKITKMLPGSPTLARPSTAAVSPQEYQDITGNPFFNPSALMSYIENFFDVVDMMKDLKKVETKIELNARAITWQLAQDAASEIMSAAKDEAKMFHMLAANNIAQIGFTAFTMAGSVNSMGRARKDYNKQMKGLQAEKSRLINRKNTFDSGKPVTISSDPARAGAAPEPGNTLNPKDMSKEARTKQSQKMSNEISKQENVINNAKAKKFENLSSQRQYHMFMWQAVQQIGQQAGQAYENIIRAQGAIEKAEHEAELKLIQGKQELNRMDMQKASEGFKSAEEMINNVLQKLDKMIQQTYSSITWTNG